MIETLKGGKWCDVVRENYKYQRNLDRGKSVIDIAEKDTYSREIYKAEKFRDKMTETCSRIRSKFREITFSQSTYGRENSKKKHSFQSTILKFQRKFKMTKTQGRKVM